MDNLLNSICDEYKLIFYKNLELGCNSDTVCLATNATGLHVVIKLAESEKAIMEIKNNKKGYDQLVKYNLGFFIPEIIACKIGKKQAFLIMENLGPNFLYQIKHSETPLDLYLTLIKDMRNVYSKSLRKGIEGRESLKNLIGKILELYERYVCVDFDLSRRIFPLLQSLKDNINFSNINFYCFSNWDFTPENIYITKNGVRYSDPHTDVLGIPIIDVACFSGLAKLYDLPNNNEGFEKLKNFAITDVSEILRIPINQATKIFFLGRILQCFMSIRFRYKQNYQQSELIFQEARDILEKEFN